MCGFAPVYHLYYLTARNANIPSGQPADFTRSQIHLSRSMRDKDRESSAALARTRGAAHTNRAAKAMHNSMSHPQAKSSPSLSFGRKEWLEDADRVISRDSATSICQSNPNTTNCWIPPIGRRAGTEKKTAALGSSLHCIHQQS